MSDFAAASGFSETRPAYTGENDYDLTLTLGGANSLTGYTFSAAMYAPDGTPAPGTPTAVLLSASNRTVAVVLPGQAIASDYLWVVRRTDDSSGDVVARGVIEVSNPGAG